MQPCLSNSTIPKVVQLKTIVLYCRRNARFLVHTSPPRKFSERAARFLIRPASPWKNRKQMSILLLSLKSIHFALAKLLQPHLKISPIAIFAFYSLNYSLAARLQDNSRPKSPTKVETKRKLHQFKATFHLTIYMCGQRATGKLQRNNYHHGS